MRGRPVDPTEETAYDVELLTEKLARLEKRLATVERDLARVANVAQQGQGAIAVEILNDVIGHYVTPRST